MFALYMCVSISAWQIRSSISLSGFCAARSPVSGETRLKTLSRFVEAALQTPPYVQVRFSARQELPFLEALFLYLELKMIAVFVNCATILIGCITGLLFAKKIPQKVTDSIQLACGLVSFIMGVQMRSEEHTSELQSR